MYSEFSFSGISYHYKSILSIVEEMIVYLPRVFARSETKPAWSKTSTQYVRSPSLSRVSVCLSVSLSFSLSLSLSLSLSFSLYIYTYNNIYAYMKNINTFTYIYIYIYMHTHIFICICIYRYIYECINRQIYIAILSMHHVNADKMHLEKKKLDRNCL